MAAAKATKNKEKERRYRKEWENDFVWVAKSPDGYPMCTYCRSIFDCKKSRLTEHASSVMHLKNARNHKNDTKLSDLKNVIVLPKDDQVKIAEMRLAGEISKHCPVLSVDHISDTIAACSDCTKQGCRLYQSKSAEQHAHCNARCFGQVRTM